MSVNLHCDSGSIFFVRIYISVWYTVIALLQLVYITFYINLEPGLGAVGKSQLISPGVMKAICTVETPISC